MDALLSGEAVWRAYRADATHPIDLRTADVSGRDLTGRDLSGCLLAGATADHAFLARADLRGAQLDDASFVGADCQGSQWSASAANLTLRGADFTGANLISVRLEDCDLRGASLVGASISGQLTGCDLRELDLTTALVTDAHLVGCQLAAASMNAARLTRVQMVNCRGAWAAEGLVWSFGSLDGCEVDQWDVTGSEFDRVTIRSLLGASRARIRLSALSNCDISGPFDGPDPFLDCRLVGCTITAIDLQDGGLVACTLDDCLLAHCVWPHQRGKVGPLGRWHAPPQLLSSPIQDLRGVAPGLRRTIADAQFLAERQSAATGTSRFWFVFWGLTTGYGTSFARLVWVVGFVAVVLTAITGIALGIRTSAVPCPCEWWGLFISVLSTGTGVGTKAIDPEAGQTGVVVGNLSKFIGLLALGVFGGLVANRIGRLSSQ